MGDSDKGMWCGVIMGATICSFLITKDTGYALGIAIGTGTIPAIIVIFHCFKQRI